MILKKLTIEMREKDHTKLKIRAASNQVLIKEYVIDAIAKFMEIDISYYTEKKKKAFDRD